MEGGNQYLIPANSKKSMLIFCVGICMTILLLIILPTENVAVAICCVIPGLIAAFLVLPVPNYHNMLQLIAIILNFYTERQKFIWKGWCYRDEFKSEEKNK